jgi:hypothetical protein
MLQCQPIYRHMAYFYHTSLLKPKIRVWGWAGAGAPPTLILGYLHIATLHTVQVATTIQSIEALISKEILRKVPRSATFLVSYCNSLLNLLTGYSNLI